VLLDQVVARLLDLLVRRVLGHAQAPPDVALLGAREHHELVCLGLGLCADWGGVRSAARVALAPRERTTQCSGGAAVSSELRGAAVRRAAGVEVGVLGGRSKAALLTQRPLSCSRCTRLDLGCTRAHCEKNDGASDGISSAVARGGSLGMAVWVCASVLLRVSRCGRWDPGEREWSSGRRSWSATDPAERTARHRRIRHRTHTQTQTCRLRRAHPAHAPARAHHGIVAQLDGGWLVSQPVMTPTRVCRSSYMCQSVYCVHSNRCSLAPKTSILQTLALHVFLLVWKNDDGNAAGAPLVALATYRNVASVPSSSGAPIHSAAAMDRATRRWSEAWSR
jgi:hypothetical protein